MRDVSENLHLFLLIVSYHNTLYKRKETIL